MKHVWSLRFASCRSLTGGDWVMLRLTGPDSDFLCYSSPSIRFSA